MRHNPHDVFKKLLPKLKPWQQRWIACRAAMRVFPTIGARGEFGFWKSETKSIVGIAQLPWYESFYELPSLEVTSAITAVKYDVKRAVEETTGYDGIGGLVVCPNDR